MLMEVLIDIQHGAETVQHVPVEELANFVLKQEGSRHFGGVHFVYK